MKAPQISGVRESPAPLTAEGELERETRGVAVEIQDMEED